MITAGVTGGIGSGKTTFCKELEKLGAHVVYADNLAKEVMVKDAVVISRLKDAFGEETYNIDGSLNKPHLINEAFGKERAGELNKIVHPAVDKAFREIVKHQKESGAKIVVKEAALLLNNGRPENLDVVVLILSDRGKQIERVKKRDEAEEEDVVARMNKQPVFEELIALADYTVYNNGSLNELREEARKLYRKLMQ